MKKIAPIFLKGLVAILPLTLSIYFTFWFFDLTEGFFNQILAKVLPIDRFPKGTGIVVGLSLIFLIGLILNVKLINSLYQKILEPIKSLPIVKIIYGAVEDFMFYVGSSDKKMNRVVEVKLPDQSFSLIGLITREDLEEIPSMEEQDKVAVLVPMSYALGGYTLFVPRSCLTPVNIDVDKAMKSALTAWMKKDN